MSVRVFQTCTSYTSYELKNALQIRKLQGFHPIVRFDGPRQRCNLHIQRVQRRQRSTVSQSQTNPTGPLQGIKILDLTRVLAVSEQIKYQEN